jgi:predicted amidohydrolase YtcJ
LDVVAFPHYAQAPTSALDAYSRKYVNHLRIGGVKIDLDGGSPGRTAYLREPYFKQHSGEVKYRGYPRFADQDQLNELVVSYYKRAVPVLIHALGDAAVDQAIAAVSAAERAVAGQDRRTQLIHLQQIQEDQLDAVRRLHVTLTFQVAHVYYFGDVHQDEIFGPERAARITPLRSAIDRALPVSIHTDAPVHPVDQMTLIWAAVNRQTAGGRVLGPPQRITVLEALQASTIGPAYQFFEERDKGSLEVGKLADFVILDRNPLAEPPESLRTIGVVETIKEGVTVFLARPRP